MKPFEPGFVEELVPQRLDLPVNELSNNIDESHNTEAAQFTPGFVDTAVAPAMPALTADWASELPPVQSRGSGAVTWVVAGAALFIAVWAILTVIGFVFDQMARSSLLGVATIVSLAATLAIIARGAIIEVGSYRRLQVVDQFRSRIQHNDASVQSVQLSAMAWLDGLPANSVEVSKVRTALETCASPEEVRAILRHQVLEPLSNRASDLGLRAGLQAGSLVAITPSPALDGLVASWRSVVLIREVAMLYGLRPSLSVTIGLLRRVAWTAVGVAGVDIAATHVAEHFLNNAPILKHIVGAVPGAGITARRQYRLAQAIADACSPLERQRV